MTETAANAPAATRRQWAGLAVLALPTLLSAMDFSVLFLALPRLGTELRPSSTQLLWITDIYGFMVAGFLVTMGAIGNRIGQRKLLMIGAAAFGIASVAAAYSASAGMLIGARALLGIAGASLMPSTLGLISAMFRQPGQRATAISLWAACLLTGTAIGPVVGGVLLQAFWWGSVFLMGLPVMAVLLVAAPVLLPENRNPGEGRIDVTSVALPTRCSTCACCGTEPSPPPWASCWSPELSPAALASCSRSTCSWSRDCHRCGRASGPSPTRPG